MSTTTQHNAMPYLLCDGEPQHITPVPRVRQDGGATGPIECSECGAKMIVVDVLIAVRDATWGTLGYDGRMRRYWS